MAFKTRQQRVRVTILQQGGGRGGQPRGPRCEASRFTPRSSEDDTAQSKTSRDTRGKGQVNGNKG